MHSARRGLGSDVAGSRPYHPGDDVDAIDWNASAKLSAARSSDEFIVRERFAEEAPRVVVVADRRRAMQLFPPEFPWLSKPRAAAAALEAIAASAFASRGLFGYVDLADELNPPSEELWLRVLERRWDAVAVVIQDPLWERSFPDVSGVAVPIVNAETGRAELLRVTAAEARARRVEHEARYEELVMSLPVLGVDVVPLGSSDELDVLDAFLEWADERTGLAHAAIAWGA